MQFQTLACPGDGAPTCEVTFPPVPSGSRLVLEYVNASISFAASGLRRTALLFPGESIYVLPVRSAPDPDFAIVSESVLAYFEGGQTPVFQIALSDGTDTPLVTAALTGYLVNVQS